MTSQPATNVLLVNRRRSLQIVSVTSNNRTLVAVWMASNDRNDNHRVDKIKRLSLAAQMIRENIRAVTAEQLAPYCDAPDPENIAATFVDESFVLPIVSQLDGEPRVMDDRDIIYVFPDLQVSASTSPPWWHEHRHLE